MLAMQLSLLVDKIAQRTISFGHVAMSIFALVLRKLLDSFDQFAPQYCRIERMQEGTHFIILRGLLLIYYMYRCWWWYLLLDLHFRWWCSSAKQTAAIASANILGCMETRTQSAWRQRAGN